MIQKITMELHDKVSFNQALRMHWRRWKEKVDEFHWAVYNVKDKKKVELYPVDITYNFYFKNNPLDATNCAFMGKIIEDALVRLEILENDDPKFVKGSHFHSQKSPKSRGDYVEITIQHDGK